MDTAFKEVAIAVSPTDNGKRSVDVFVFDGAEKIGRYQVRTNVEGSRDVYHSDIEGGSFVATRKVSRVSGNAPCGDDAVAAIIDDLKKRGLVAPALDDPAFSLGS